MGNMSNKLMERIRPIGAEKRIIMIGLDNAGKTTILSFLKRKTSTRKTTPTIGFNVETIEASNGLVLLVWDIGGQAKVRKLWKDYCRNVEGMLFVVDSTDRERIWEARHELHGLLEEGVQNGTPCVVLANKQDLPNAMGPDEVAAGLALDGLRTTQKLFLQPTCAVRGTGLNEAMSALAKCLK